MKVGYVVPVLVVAAALGGYGLRGADAGAPCLVPATPAAGALTFSGDGTGVSEPFALGQGTALVAVAADPGAEGTVAIDVLAAPGSPQTGVYALLPETAGPVEQTTAMTILTPDRYLLRVASDGPWTVTVEQ